MSKNKTAESIGYIGAFFLTITLIPQILHTIKTKKVNDISFLFIGFQITTCLLFLIYGIMIQENPLIVSNGVVLLQLIIFFGLKVRYR